ncbi:MAG: hypothetical protein ACK5KT_06290 [Dysgonomonas sp.]
MAAIKGIDGMSPDEVKRELDNGGRFVIFTYTISLIVVSFKRSSDIYFVRANEFPIKYGWWCLLVSLIMGWWGIPWGPIYTIQSLYYAFAGKNMTDEVLSALGAQLVPTQPTDYQTGYNVNNGGMNDNPYPINNMINRERQ